MKEYKVIKDVSLTHNNNPKEIEKALNEASKEGFKYIGSCAYDNKDHWSHIYVFLERDKKESE
jgi:hypothetical protein